MPDDPAEVVDLRHAADTANAELAKTNGGRKRGKRGKTDGTGWTSLPPDDDDGADAYDLRAWIAQAIPLPKGAAVTTVEQIGPRTTDMIRVGLRIRGKPTTVRFANGSDIASPAKLRTTLAMATAGRVRVRSDLTQPQAGEILIACCRLATMIAHATEADETCSWLRGYLEDGDLLRGWSFDTLDDRAALLTKLRQRDRFGPTQARKYLAELLPPDSRWAIVVDRAGVLWIRASEFACYLRHVLQVGRIGEPRLDALVHEAGGDRVEQGADLRGHGGKQIWPLVLYRLPTALAVGLPD